MTGAEIARWTVAGWWALVATLGLGCPASPKTTGIRSQARPLPEGRARLADVFRSAGYETGAVVANFHVGQRFGFDRGFAHFVESWQDAWQRESGDAVYRNAPGKVKRYTDARTVTDQALALLEGRDPARPAFLRLHYMDPHGPYLPPPAYAERFRGAYPPELVPLRVLPRYQVQRRPGGAQPETDLAFYRAQYDREIRYLDDELARLLRGVEEASPAGRGLVIALSADHGESLNDHGDVLQHGRSPYEATAHVPLVLVDEDRLPAGRVVDRPVGLIDLGPTLLELAGLPVPESFEGTSLLAAVRAPDAAPDHVFLESGTEEPTQLAVQQGRWKLIHVRAPADRRRLGGARYELYDLERDPAEQQNVATEHPEVVGQLSAVLSQWYASGPRWEPAAAVAPESLRPEEREMLRSLGYLDAEKQAP